MYNAQTYLSGFGEQPEIDSEKSAAAKLAPPP